MLNLKLDHSNVRRLLNQVVEDPEFYMKKNYEKYRNELDFRYDPIFIEYSIVSCGANSDMIAIPLKNGKYYINAGSHSPLKEGALLDPNEVLYYLAVVAGEYNYREYDYYYDI